MEPILSEKKSRVEGFNSKRFAALALVLLIAVGALAGRWIFERSRPPKNELHGDGDDALAALDPTLAKLPSADRLPYLLRSVRDPHAGLRYAAVDGLGKYRTPEAASAIEAAFRDSASTVRLRVVETLHTVDRERGLLLLLAALQDEDTWIRQAAATQLALRSGASTGPAKAAGNPAAPADEPKANATRPSMLADRRCVPTLIRVLDDPDEKVVRSAATMLERLTGRGMKFRTIDGPDASRRAILDWKAWWRAHSAEFAPPPTFADVRPIRPTRSDPAPEVDLSDIDGHRLRFSALRGRVTLLNFWGTWCPPCRQEMPDIERIHESLGPRGLTVIGAAVSEQGGPEALRSWCAKNHVTYRQVLATPEMKEAYGGIEEVPVSLMIDKSGHVRYRWEGPRDYPTFRAAVQRLLLE
jgi:thiol-disulfide isomerase/thioredoxin